MQIKVLDHIIIGDNSYISLDGEGLVEQYESDLPNLRVKSATEAKLHLYHVDVSNPKIPWAERKQK